MRRSLGEVAALALLVCVVVFFYRDFITGRACVWDDTLTEYYPGVNYFAKSIAAGRFPLWIPGVRDGMPFYSDTQIAVFYPLEWLLPLFVKAGRLPFLVYQRYIFFHCLLGAGFAYAFLRGHKLNPISALAGALGFCLSGFFTLRATVNFVMIQAYTWLPLELLLVQQFVYKGGRWRWLGLVGAMAASLLAGHPQTTLYCWYLVFAYWLYCAYVIRRDRGRNRKSAIGVCATVEAAKFIGTCALVLGIAAVTLLPGAENWLHTARPSRSFGETADTSLPYRGLIRLFVPNFFGRLEKQSGVNTFWGADPLSPSVLQTPTTVLTTAESIGSRPGFWQYWECNAYSGQIFWLAAVLVLSNWKRVANRRTLSFFLIVWLMAMWFMLGRYGGLFNVLYHILPGASFFRGPAKMSCVATFAAAVVIAHFMELVQAAGTKLRLWPAVLLGAGYGALLVALDFGGEDLFRELREPAKLALARNETWYALAIIGCSLAALWAARRVRPVTRNAGLLILMALFIADADHSYAGFSIRYGNPDQEYYRATPEFARWMEHLRQRRPFRCAQRLAGQLVDDWVWRRNLPFFYDFLETPDGYTSYYLENVSQVQGITNQPVKLALQNVEMAFSWDQERNLAVFSPVECLPRAKFFAHTRRFESRAALLAALDSNEIDLHNEGAVSAPVDFHADEGADRRAALGTNDEVRFVSRTPEAYGIVYQVSQPGIVFVSQAFYPGWIADGGRFNMVEIFGAFQGIVIPEAGKGEIRVVFSPPILKLALVVSGLSVLIAGLVAVLVIRRNAAPET